LLQERYQVLAVIGQGSGGTVYRALDRDTACLVAVKRLLGGRSDVPRQAFEREAHLLSQLSHPSLPAVLYGYDGNDTLIGGGDGDMLDGGDGSDNLDGGPGDDMLYGGYADIIGASTDVLMGGDGDDEVTSGDPDPLGVVDYYCDGGNGFDVLWLQCSTTLNFNP
jgi:serine/threonine protein kinase